MLRLVTGIVALLLVTGLRAEDGPPKGEVMPSEAPRIYKQVMPDGSVQFTDKPLSSGAEAVDIRSVNTVERPRKKKQPVDTEKKAVDPPVVPRVDYEVLTISSPGSGATIRNPVEPVPIEVAIKPQLQPGDRLELMDNGKVLSGTSLVQPERGAHRLQARILNAEGKILIESDVIEIYIHRTTVGNIERRQRPPERGEVKMRPGTSTRPVQPFRPSSSRP